MNVQEFQLFSLMNRSTYLQRLRKEFRMLHHFCRFRLVILKLWKNQELGWGTSELNLTKNMKNFSCVDRKLMNRTEQKRSDYYYLYDVFLIYMLFCALWINSFCKISFSTILLSLRYLYKIFFFLFSTYVWLCIAVYIYITLDISIWFQNWGGYKHNTINLIDFSTKCFCGLKHNKKLLLLA